CKKKYYIPQEFPPAIVVKPKTNKETARNIVLKELRDRDISKYFLKHSFYEKGMLYYIPNFEVRGIRSGFTSPSSTEPPEYTYLAYEYLEKTNDLNELDLKFFQPETVADALISAEQVPFNPVEMRKSGFVLPSSNINLLMRNQNPHALESVEHYFRLVYFPIWEISYSFKGIIFKSYVSGVDGKPIKIQGLRSHKRKLWMAMSGLLALAVIMGRGINAGLGGLIITSIIGLPAAAILFPYFWELFAFQEIVEKRGEIKEYQTINYTENALEKYGQKFIDGLIRLMGIVVKEKDQDPGDFY
ncbi:MAG: hypothetical protein MUF15_27870, partial [Acidobacteria bacterium]|nr:hypothetical protein [Acidobacteriota bacterium]